MVSANTFTGEGMASPAEEELCPWCRRVALLT